MGNAYIFRYYLGVVWILHMISYVTTRIKICNLSQQFRKQLISASKVAFGKGRE